jgi:hypothetical protein
MSRRVAESILHRQVDRYRYLVVTTHKPIRLANRKDNAVRVDLKAMHYCGDGAGNLAAES